MAVRLPEIEKESPSKTKVRHDKFKKHWDELFDRLEYDLTNYLCDTKADKNYRLFQDMYFGMAVTFGDIKRMELFYHHGANIFDRHHSNLTTALYNGDLKAIGFLLKHGESLNNIKGIYISYTIKQSYKIPEDKKKEFLKTVSAMRAKSKRRG